MSNKFGTTLKTLRESKSIDQESVGAAIGRSHAAVSQYESGKREVPTEDIKALARHLDVDPLDLLEIRLNDLISSTIEKFKRSK